MEKGKIMETEYSRDKKISLMRFYACVRCGFATQKRKKMIEHFKTHRGEKR